MEQVDFSEKAKQLVDTIKAICNNAGLGGDANEYKIVTQGFLYKFLNDKFLYEVGQIDPNLKSRKDLETLNEGDYSLLMIKLGTKSAHLKPEHLLDYLFEHQNDDNFAKLFDNTLNDIAVDNSEVFSVHTAGNTDIRLFEEELIQSAIHDKSQHNIVAKKIINALADQRFNFDMIFSAGFDFFSTLFEYMIKDYNKDGGGKYAEYYTPHSVAKIMAEIMVGDSHPSNVKVYDPSAGSGTLLMNIASKIGTDRSTIYSQDVSQKSSNLLRLNLILNGLSHSINNIVQGNTIIDNRHTQKMDFIVSNPPFDVVISDWMNDIASLPNSTERFPDGTIPPKAKDGKHYVYLLFLQHIIWSLKDSGGAAIVVPTGFITAQTGMGKKIRQRLVENKWLKGVVSMPSNIFATTGTNASVIFIDKSNKDEVVLVDATKLGKKVKDGKNQKTLLSSVDEQMIIDAFSTKDPIEDFSVVVSYDQIKEKNFSLSAGQYFDIKIEHIDITPEEFEAKLAEHKNNLNDLFTESRKLEDEINEQLGKLRYDR